MFVYLSFAAHLCTFISPEAAPQSISRHGSSLSQQQQQQQVGVVAAMGQDFALAEYHLTRSPRGVHTRPYLPLLWNQNHRLVSYDTRFPCQYIILLIIVWYHATRTGILVSLITRVVSYQVRMHHMVRAGAALSLCIRLILPGADLKALTELSCGRHELGAVVRTACERVAAARWLFFLEDMSRESTIIFRSCGLEQWARSLSFVTLQANSKEVYPPAILQTTSRRSQVSPLLPPPVCASFFLSRRGPAIPSVRRFALFFLFSSSARTCALSAMEYLFRVNFTYAHRYPLERRMASKSNILHLTWWFETLVSFFVAATTGSLITQT